MCGTKSKDPVKLRAASIADENGADRPIRFKAPFQLERDPSTAWLVPRLFAQDDRKFSAHLANRSKLGYRATD